MFDRLHIRHIHGDWRTQLCGAAREGAAQDGGRLIYARPEEGMRTVISDRLLEHLLTCRSMSEQFFVEKNFLKKLFMEKIEESETFDEKKFEREIFSQIVFRQY